ncbi:MAG: methyl-accepting protein [Archangium sp.]|nr:methyl-accepting protein [Archangium sp.]
MAARSQRPGLTGAIIGVLLLALIALVAVLFFVVPAQADAYLTDTLWERGKAVAKEIERKVPIVARDGIDTEASAEVNNIVGGERAIRNVWVIVCSGECRPKDVIAQSSETSLATTEAVLKQFNAREQNVQLQLDTGELLVADPVQLKGGLKGFVLISLDRARIDEGVRSVRKTLLIALVMSVLIFMALVTVLSRLLIIGPLATMRAMAMRLAEADLSGRVEGAPTRELDELAESLNSIGQGLRDTLGRVRGVAESVAQVIDQISRSASTTTSGASTVLTRVEETSSAMVEMLSSLKGIAENVEVLYQSAEESSSSIMEMSTTNDEVAANVTKMAASVEETTSAIEQTTYSIKEVARNVEDLLKNTEATNSSIREMDIAIGQVETNAYETARLSEQVSKDAETGMESIQKTIVGIDRIKDSSKTASSVIDSLGRRIGEIGNIVDVIDDVAEQTNLLALNAAIIAAQAGEHGKGFAVVADEIKDLSERTAASTKEIADLIRAVQAESRNAATAMNTGVRSVEEGVVLGREAEGALRKIQDSAKNSTQMVKAIARATVEQARGSKDVTAAVERVRETIEQINKATNEQARGSEQVMKVAEQMKLLTQHVKRSVEEQSHGGKQISRSIENINEMVTHLNRAQKEQTRGTEQVLKAIEAIRSVADQQNRSVKQLEEAIETLRNQADVLRGEVRRFRV